MILSLILTVALLLVSAYALGATKFVRHHTRLNIALATEKLRLEERNESLDRQNQLMEHQYKLFATKPVMTLLNEDQFSQLARVVSSTVLALAKQTN